jgi:hypothetical protein
MKARFNQVPLYVTLFLLSGLMGGCLGGGGSEEGNVEQSPQPTASQPFPSPSVPPAITSPSKIALTRPTNPDDRLRVIKSGRNDPFGLLVAPQPSGGSAPRSGSASGTPDPKQASNGKITITRSSNDSKDGGSGKSSALPDLSGLLKLPELPPKPELAGVKVMGVVQVGGAPRAIIQAPGEPTSRTVSIGDSLSNGQLYVKNIDMSNRAEPVVIFQQGALEFAVAVGRDPVLVASADPGVKPLRGMPLALPR